MASFEHEERSHSALAEYLQTKLHEALRLSKSLGEPDDFRCAVCCHLLHVVCDTFEYSSVVDQPRDELYSSIYVDSEKLLSVIRGGQQSVHFPRQQDFL